MLDNLENRLEEFIMEHYPNAISWEHLREWVQWFVSHDMYSLIVDENNEIVGVGFARPIKNPLDGMKDYEYNPFGEIVFLDLVISMASKITALMYLDIYRKIGNPLYVAYRRNGGQVKCFGFDRFFNKLIKKGKIRSNNYGWITSKPSCST